VCLIGTFVVAIGDHPIYYHTAFSIKLGARTEGGTNESRAGGSAMWYIIKNRWSVWIAEWRITEITPDELFDIIDI
jgi:hypothetical protein